MQQVLVWNFTIIAETLDLFQEQPYSAMKWGSILFQNLQFVVSCTTMRKVFLKPKL